MDAIAKEINAIYGQYQKATKISLGYAKKLGELLIQAKVAAGFHQFGRWMDKNLPFSHSRANMFMQIAQRWDKIPEEKRESMSFTDAQRAIGRRGEAKVDPYDDRPAVDPVVNKSVKSACAADAAELLYNTILENDDPMAVASRLMEMLSAPLFEKTIRQRQIDRRAAENRSRARKKLVDA